MEGRKTIQNLAQGFKDFQGLFAADPVVRRRSLKALSYHLPLRPWLRFFYMYVLRGGFLDSWAGFTYCRLISFYEYLIILNTRAEQRRQNGLPI